MGVARGSDRGQILFLTEYGHVIYQIEAIERRSLDRFGAITGLFLLTY